MNRVPPVCAEISAADDHKGRGEDETGASCGRLTCLQSRSRDCETDDQPHNQAADMRRVIDAGSRRSPEQVVGYESKNPQLPESAARAHERWKFSQIDGGQ